MIWKTSALFTFSLAISGFMNAFADYKPVFQTGLQTGYTYGQNGMPWPSLINNPTGNNNRGGFYVSQLRINASVDFDSTFSAFAVGNVFFADVQEVYLKKRVDNYTFTGGKFRGAGLKSATGVDEFERTTVNSPRYARIWSFYTRTINSRDYGIQIQADYMGGALAHRFFIHNANRENVGNDEPSYTVGQATQVLGMDYALDWRVSPFTMLGGHIGALANREWDEFAGNHGGWEVGYWFKTNPIVDASLNHQLDAGKLHLFNEAMILYNRELLNPQDSSATQTWGVSSQIRFEHTRRIASFFRYEYTDPTDGANLDDNLHLFTLGAIFHPSPIYYPWMKVTGEYVRVLEDGGLNTYSNDLLVCQLQMLF